MAAQLELTPTEKLTAAMQVAGITIASSFIPFSQSRNKAEKRRSLNWRVTLSKGNRVIVSTDYSAGVAHCPAHKKPATLPSGKRDQYTTEQRIAEECETGRAQGYTFSNVDYTAKGKKIEPDAADVMWSLLMDAEVLNAGGFEEWARDYCFDVDSRKAEKTYRDCLDIALKLRAGLGDETLQSLRIAAEEY